MAVVSVIVVTWNSASWLPRCLEAIRAQTHRDFELLAVDNASSDDSLSLLAGARVIRNETNRGFSAAVNQAVAVACGEFVLLVNPDCFLEPEYIGALLTAFDDDSIGAATGLLFRWSGGLQPAESHSGGLKPAAPLIDSAGIRMTRNGRHLDITVAPRQRTEVFGVSGAAAMYRMAFLRDVAIDGEIFDEDFFAWREDADLAWRGRLFGWRAVCEPRAVAHHVRRVTPEVRRELPPEINMHSLKNRFLLRLKNEGAYLALRNAPFELARDIVVFVAALTIERTSLPALAWLWRNRARVLAKRREIQRRRRISDRELARWFR